MDLLEVRTSGGNFAFAGRRYTDRRRPSLLAVSGAFAPADHYHDLVDVFPGANVLVASLPGMRVPWTRNGVPELTAGLQEAVAWLFGDLPLVVLGISTGALLTLGLTGPNLVRGVALEPFFQTADLWPFIEDSRRRLEAFEKNRAMVDFLWRLFGIRTTQIENRDYRHLIRDLSVPTDAVIGGLPLLPKRPVQTWPSFASEEDRALLRANPLVTVHEGPPNEGHAFGSLPGDGRRLVHGLLKAALHQAAKSCG